jgi:tRNA-2-methylthio-N6-dimethylallyladenosine synthase
MIRRYSAAEYIERTLALQEEVPGLTLSTDVIVGFPGETDEEFEETLTLVRQVGFVGIFGFTYSQRPYTPALKLADDVSEEQKGRRLARLFALVDEQKACHLASRVGQEEIVLLDGRGKTSDLMGRTERNEIVHLRHTSEGAPVEARDGAMASVRILEAYKNSLSGELIRVTTPSGLSAEAWGGGRKLKTALGEAGRRILPVLGGEHGSH